MKSRVLLLVGLSVGLFNSINSEDNKVKKDNTKAQLNVTNVVVDNSVKLEANVKFVETFTVMGEGDSGQILRKEIESKRDLASQIIQDESKKIEKAKNE